MMKLVIFGAVASMCLAPMWRLAEIGAVSWPFAVLMEAVAIPLVLAVVAFPMVRKGPHKDWLVRALLMTSLGIGLGAAIYSCSGPQQDRLPSTSGPVPARPWGLFGAIIVVLGVLFVILLRQFVPDRNSTGR